MEHLTAFAGAYDKWVTEKPMEAKVCTILKQTFFVFVLAPHPEIPCLADNDSDSDEHHRRLDGTSHHQSQVEESKVVFMANATTSAAGFVGLDLHTCHRLLVIMRPSQRSSMITM
jgi:hypothetical protein